MGARIPFLAGHPETNWTMWLLSIFWLVGCTNAFNLIDGMDGLASGVGLFATLTNLLPAILQGNWGLALAAVPLAGCLLAFLRYNFNPASIFLGDSGSLTVGFLLSRTAATSITSCWGGAYSPAWFRTFFMAPVA
jgi:UDP-GlcNAc:undecaprenyl-phosphate GlcNAc-1-phosphate transferase